jgi:mevalonate kinase
MSTTTGRAGGKVILFGEHAVVYGVPAIAVGVERGVFAQATPLDAGPSTLVLAGWGVEIAETDLEPPLGRALRAILDATPGSRPVRVEVRAELPPGGGLGCSAAMGVAIARALDPSVGEDALAERAMAWELVFHGNPSGIDAAVSAQGGCLIFTKGSRAERVRVSSPLHLCVGNTGMASSTKSMVEAVARLRARRPEVVAKAFDGIEALVRNARLAIEAGDRVAIGRLMDLNQMILSGLFVSTQEIERLCALARDAGADGAKLTGAGGGGSVVALVADAAVAERVLSAWNHEGFDGFVTHVERTIAPEAEMHEALP